MSATQSIFGLEQDKGVLVVAPAGDAMSYRDVDVAHEVGAINSRIDAMHPAMVVMDLGGSRYFGSVMIGAISEFAERVRTAAGAFAVCNVSPDTASVLRVMKLDERWPQFDSRRAAVKYVRKSAG